MNKYTVQGGKITLTEAPSECAYSIEIGGERWTMSEKPFVSFSDGTDVKLTSPVS